MDNIQKNSAKSILLYLLVASFLIFEMGVQVSPSIMTAELMRDLHLGTFGLGIMSGFYFYTYASFQIPSGMLFDTFNPRKIITLSMIVCSIGTLTFGLSTNIVLGSLARLLMGSGSAFAFVSVLVVTADLFDSKHFALMTGITQMLAALGAMSGQIPLGGLVNFIGWRQTMFTLSGVGIALALLVCYFLRYQKQQHITESISSSLLSNIKSILSNKQTWWIGLYAMLLWAPISGFTSLWGVPFLMTNYHFSHQQSASMVALMWIGLAIASPLLGYWSSTIERRVLPLALSAFIGLCGFAIILFAPAWPRWTLVIALLATGGACTGQALSFSVIHEINPMKQRATAIAINNIAVVISGAIFQPMIGKLLQTFNHIQYHNMIYSPVGFQRSLSLILGCFFLGTLTALFFIKETYCRTKHDEGV